MLLNNPKVDDKEIVNTKNMVKYVKTCFNQKSPDAFLKKTASTLFKQLSPQLLPTERKDNTQKFVNITSGRIFYAKVLHDQRY